MRTVNFKDAIVYPVISRMGYDPDKDLFGDTGAALARYINAWVRKCWDAADWPELSRIETRTPVNHIVPYDVAAVAPPNWAQTDSYNLDDVVEDPVSPRNFYISLQNANTGNALTDASWWALLAAWDSANKYSPSDKVVDPATGLVYVAQAYITPGTVLSRSLDNPKAWQLIPTQQQPTTQITNIGKVLKVYLVDPSLNDGPFDTPFRCYDQGFHCGYDHGTTVWVKFMSRPPRYSLDVWDATVTYTGGTTETAPVEYYLPDGNCYRSLGPSNINHLPPTNPLWWVLVPFPAVIAEPVWRGAYSDMLREEGQTDKAMVEEQAALQELEATIKRNLTTRYDTLTDQQTGVPRMLTEPLVGVN